MAVKDSEQNKAAGILAYIIFFIPLLMAPKSKFAKFHANQGLLLLILAVGVNVIGGIVPILGGMVIQPLGTLAVIVLWIIGIMNASSGEEKPLPVIGNYTIIK